MFRFKFSLGDDVDIGRFLSTSTPPVPSGMQEHVEGRNLPCTLINAWLNIDAEEREVL